MSDTRTYIVPDGQENSTNQMLPWMAMMNGGMGGFGKRRRGGMRDSDYDDDEDYPRYY